MVGLWADLCNGGTELMSVKEIGWLSTNMCKR